VAATIPATNAIIQASTAAGVQEEARAGVASRRGTIARGLPMPLTAAQRATVCTALNAGTVVTLADVLALIATAATGGVTQQQVNVGDPLHQMCEYGRPSAWGTLRKSDIHCCAASICRCSCPPGSIFPIPVRAGLRFCLRNLPRKIGQVPRLRNRRKPWGGTSLRNMSIFRRTVTVVVDNYATHKHPKVQKWLAQHPRWTFHFTPTSASWLNAVEGFFAKLRDGASSVECSGRLPTFRLPRRCGACWSEWRPDSDNGPSLRSAGRRLRALS
jgi:hypothetical protein